MHVEECGEEKRGRRACVHWGHQTALLGGLHFSALHWGLISQTITNSPCTAPALLVLTELCSVPSRHKSSSQKPCSCPAQAPLTVCAQHSSEKWIHPWCVHTEPGRAGQDSVNELHVMPGITAACGTPCCLLAPVSKLVKPVSFVRTKINSHRFSTLS